jgi:hypothetical protein
MECEFLEEKNLHSILIDRIEERNRFVGGSLRARDYSNETALSLRSRRSGTKFANPTTCGFAH